MIHHFSYNGKDSRRFGVYITDKTAYDKPERDISMIQVPGRNGDLIVDNGGYKNLSVKYDLRIAADNIRGINNPDDFSHAFEKAANWLQPTNNYFVLEDSYNPGYYRMGCIKSAISVKTKHPLIADFSVTFSCKPYRYRVESEEIEITENTTINNEENAESLPLIRVYTNVVYDSETETDHYFSIGDNTFHVKNINGYVDIDSDMMNVFKGTTAMNNNYYSDTFPSLMPGSNVVALLQNVSKLVITPRWRAL